MSVTGQLYDSCGVIAAVTLIRSQIAYIKDLSHMVQYINCLETVGVVMGALNDNCCGSIVR